MHCGQQRRKTSITDKQLQYITLAEDQSFGQVSVLPVLKVKECWANVDNRRNRKGQKQDFVINFAKKNGIERILGTDLWSSQTQKTLPDFLPRSGVIRYNPLI